MAHVFISYVHQKRDVVDRLAKELRNRGVTVWLDRDDIEPGARWRDAIKKAIIENMAEPKFPMPPVNRKPKTSALVICRLEE